MKCTNCKSSVNKTYIIESVEQSDTFSACTGLYSNKIISCSGNTNIELGTNLISFNKPININGPISATTYYGDGSQLSGVSKNDFYTTGATLNSDNILYFDRNDTLSGYSVDLSSLVGDLPTGQTWLNPVISFSDYLNPTGVTNGSRYISSGNTSGWTINNIYEELNDTWVETIVTEGNTVVNLSDNLIYIFNGSIWSASTTNITSVWAKSGNDIFNLNSGNVNIITTLNTSKDSIINGITIGRGGGNSGQNIAFGNNALAKNTSTGTFNCAIGAGALYNNLTGDNNTAIGVNSLYNSTLSHNIGIGRNAGQFIEDGTANSTPGSSIFIGYNTRSKTAGNTNQIVIGYNAIGNGSNTATLGNTSITGTYLNGSIYSGNTDLLDIFSRTDYYITGFTYDNANTLTLSKNNNTTLKTTINTVTGLTINNGELKIINDNTNSLYTTKKTVINSGTTLLYSIEYSAYTSVHIDYSLYGNSSARAGFFTSVWYDNNIKYTEFSTSDIGTTSNVTLYSIISGSSINILANSTTNNWNIKTIIKTI